VTPETVAINLGRGGNDAARRPVPPQGPAGISPSSRPAAKPTPIPSSRSSKTGPPAATAPSLISKPHPQKTAHARDHQGPGVAGDPAAWMLMDCGSAIAAMRIADPAASDPHPQSPPPAARPEPRHRAQPDRPPTIAPVSTSRQMTSGQEPATKPPEFEATQP
jgi:hypothetical protein